MNLLLIMLMLAAQLPESDDGWGFYYTLYVYEDTADWAKNTSIELDDNGCLKMPAVEI
ncbi:hypothetical protein D5125_02815 [Magnetovirga frankeli]|uniref:hypothetical protein n=1 Tax=Magnetovirga frankeli TaxID=947516 RepID=UPI0012934228|nr:hypothetical protein D5125_02815 [gamma proteobacterium SS-5]